MQRSMPEKMDMSIAVDRKEDEMVITKHTASIFIGTDFERMVRNAGITTIVFTGISAELGVESSARDTLDRDFTVIVSGAVSSSDKDAHTPARCRIWKGFLRLHRQMNLQTSGQYNLDRI